MSLTYSATTTPEVTTAMRGGDDYFPLAYDTSGQARIRKDLVATEGKSRGMAHTGKISKAERERQEARLAELEKRKSERKIK